MKIRQNFVSNSSSTSFCVVGIHTVDWDNYNYGPKYQELLDKLEPSYYGHGLYTTENDELEAWGNGENYPECIGFDAKKILENKSLKQARREFCRYIKKEYKEDIDEKDVELIYGEAGDG